MRTDSTEHQTEEPRRRVGVLVTHLTPGLQAFLESLEDAFPVRFEHTESLDAERFDGALLIGPKVSTEASRQIPTLIVGAPTDAHDENVMIDIAEEQSLARALRGARIPEKLHSRRALVLRARVGASVGASRTHARLVAGRRR